MPAEVRPQAGSNGARAESKKEREMEELNKQLGESTYIAGFHGDTLIGNRRLVKTGKFDDFKKIVTLPHLPDVFKVAKKMIMGGGLDIKAGAPLIGSMPIESAVRANLIEAQVRSKYERMLHPPLSYLGGAFKYRTADGKFNNALFPHLGQAGAPYAKTVPAITHPLGALPDPGDLFDRLMARTEDRPSKSGLSSMLIYHATIIIHDIFRTNDKDKNISDTSSYLDLSPLYGFTDEMQRQVRDGRYKLGLLKPDTFAEDRLLRQPPGVCIMLVMYNRYHNYAATQLRRINENGRFSVPAMFQQPRPLAAAERFVSDERKESKDYKAAVTKFEAEYKVFESSGRDDTLEPYKAAYKALQEHINACRPTKTTEEGTAWDKNVEAFNAQYDAAWDKLDDDLFNTARLITCGLYIQISIHDYLRALMGFHQFNTNFTLDPRVHDTNCKGVSRGIGNQVTVEFNVLYRFHCAISAKDEKYTEELMRELFGKKDAKDWDPKDVSLNEFLKLTTDGRRKEAEAKAACKKKIDDAKKDGEKDPKCQCKVKHVHSPEDQEFGLHSGPKSFKRNAVTNLFDDEQMVQALTEAMDDPISNFGPRNVPKSLKAVEIMGILQARKWEIGTLNDFRQFFGMKRHETFESISGDVHVQNALRDLYEHPDKVELYPGIFCESDAEMNGDPGPSDLDSALWAAIFSDAITLVRSDRFYTVDWNTNSLTSWGMKEVTPDNDVLKSSVFHRLIQRAFPEWFPADSVRFFHPFYTSQQNATYAWEQKLSAGLKMEPKHIAKRDWRGRKKNPNEKDVFDITQSEPKKPRKPIYLDRPETILAVLGDTSDTLVHPARLHLTGLPQDIRNVVEPGQTYSKKNDKITASFEEDLRALSADLVAQMRSIIKRECIIIDPSRPGGCVYQIDIARDFAIPVVTKFVADFLGFGHLIKSEKNLHAPYSENEIYQHITNCQVHLSYNADETKTLKRRKAFKESMTFLFDLTLSHGNAGRANRFYLTRKLHEFGEWLFGLSSQQKSLQSLGFTIAQEIINNEGGARRTAGQAAAVLLLVGLDNAYNAVIAFNCVLNTFICGLYEEAETVNTLRAKVKKLKEEGDVEKGEEKKAKAEGKAVEANEHAVKAVKLAVRAEELAKTIPIPRCEWLSIQELVFDEIPSVGDMKINEAKIARAVLAAQRHSVKLPIIRVATKACKVVDPVTNNVLEFKEGDTIVCDYNPTVSIQSAEDELFAHRSSFSGAFARYHPKHLSTLCLTTMIKVVAELKNLRRGHDAQGRLKRVRIDASAETYANYMAPQRVKTIAAYVARERELAKKIEDPKEKKEREEELDKIYTNAILRPETATYLTPEWDEMIPFPTTWKLRFDGFGKSDYNNVKAFGVPGLLSSLNPTPVPDSFAPFYEAPGGESRIGGSFAASTCLCAMAGHMCKCAAGRGSKDGATSPVAAGSGYAAQGPALPGH